MNIAIGNLMTLDFMQAIKPGLIDLPPYQPGMRPTFLIEKYGVKDAIKLSSNENPIGPCEEAQQALLQTRDCLASYPDSTGRKLKEGIAEKFGITEDCITLGNGSDSLFPLLAELVVEPGDTVLAPAYSFATYGLVAKTLEANYVTSETTHWACDVDKLLQCINPKTKIIFLANPNNPTGTWLTQSQLLQLMQRLPPSLLLVVDEAYFEYMKDIKNYPDCVALQKEFPNLIITRTFSKAYGLAGLRIGYCLSHPAIANVLNNIRRPFNTNTIAQLAATYALQDNKHLERTLILNNQGRNQLQTALNKLQLTYLPSSSNFITVDFKKPAMEVFLNLLEEGIIVRPLENYKMPNHLRITIGTFDQNQRLVLALQKILANADKQ